VDFFHALNVPGSHLLTSTSVSTSSLSCLSAEFTLGNLNHGLAATFSLLIGCLLSQFISIFPCFLLSFFISKLFSSKCNSIVVHKFGFADHAIHKVTFFHFTELTFSKAFFNLLFNTVVFFSQLKNALVENKAHNFLFFGFTLA
jgi:hypothetical protein